MLLREEDRAEVRKMFEKLEHPVKIIYFHQEVNCPYCNDTRQVLKEVAELSDKIELEEVPLLIDGEKGKKYGIDKAPAIVITGEDGERSGVVFYGIPAGYEFVSLLGAIMDRGSGQVELSQKVQDEVKAIDEDVHLMVFVTPTCPYCPRAVRVAHQMAYLNPRIRAEMIEATEFPELSQEYRVMAVPKIVINYGQHSFEGAYPEHMFLDQVKRVLGQKESSAAN